MPVAVRSVRDHRACSGARTRCRQEAVSCPAHPAVGSESDHAEIRSLTPAQAPWL